MTFGRGDLKSLKTLTYLVLVIAVIQMAYYYTVLPDTIASHYDDDGNPDSYASKNLVFMIYILVLIYLYAVIFVVDLYFVRFRRFVNIPNKAYWTSTVERSRVAKKKLVHFLYLANIGTEVLLLGLYQLIFSANAKDVHSKPNVTLMTGLVSSYLIYEIVIATRIYLDFNGTQDDHWNEV